MGSVMVIQVTMSRTQVNPRYSGDGWALTICQIGDSTSAILLMTVGLGEEPSEELHDKDNIIF